MPSSRTIFSIYLKSHETYERDFSSTMAQYSEEIHFQVTGNFIRLSKKERPLLWKLIARVKFIIQCDQHLPDHYGENLTRGRPNFH